MKKFKKVFILTFLTMLFSVSAFSQQTENDALIKAIRQNDVEAAKKAIANGANPNSYYKDVPLVVYAAVFEAYWETVELLLNNGANVNLPINVPLELKKKNPAKYKEMEGLTVLHLLATKSDSTDIASKLIERGANVNAMTSNRYTPLMQASSKGFYDFVQLLVEKGADIFLKDKNGRTALDYAKLNKKTYIIEFLEKEITKKNQAAQIRNRENIQNPPTSSSTATSSEDTVSSILLILTILFIVVSRIIFSTVLKENSLRNNIIQVVISVILGLSFGLNMYFTGPPDLKDGAGIVFLCVFIFVGVSFSYKKTWFWVKKWTAKTFRFLKGTNRNSQVNVSIIENNDGDYEISTNRNFLIKLFIIYPLILMISLFASFVALVIGAGFGYYIMIKRFQGFFVNENGQFVKSETDNSQKTE